MCRTNLLIHDDAADAADAVDAVDAADAADASAYDELYHAINQPVLRNNIQNYYNVSSDSDSDSGLYWEMKWNIIPPPKTI